MAPVHYQHRPFPPDSRINWSALISKIGPAHTALGRYNQSLLDTVNPKFLLGPLQLNEAVQSSRIEGTQASLTDVMKFEGGYSPDSTTLVNDIQEIKNYFSALNIATESMRRGSITLSLDVVKTAHFHLMNSTRGQDKSPGKFRTLQNYIGPFGATTNEMTFVPIAPEDLKSALGRWENYLSADAQDRLVQCAIMHAEFEALHPFRDGNGRTGRLIIPLFMWQVGLVDEPAFFISQWLEAHREEYYDRLLAVSRDDDWTGWCSFFLDAVREQSTSLWSVIQRIRKLREETKILIEQQIRTKYGFRIMDAIFSRPMFNLNYFRNQTKIPSSTTHTLLRNLCENEILRQTNPSSGRRPALYAFPKLLDILTETQRW
ncbi:MAG: Fic family protein [Bacteroidetes bacterium]|nr:Fic family protein [Bacteroidota bacterium]